jgi:hypothetical protein
VLDTIEDAPWRDCADQLNAYSTFENFIEHPAEESLMLDWQKTFPQQIPDGERKLLQATGELFADFHKLPTAAQEPLRRLLNSMLGGMRYYSGQRVDGQLRLRDVQDVNLYCLFVAGVVGEALSQLLLVAGAKVEADNPKWIVDAHHFGLFLQKVNLLKDQKEDEAVGRFLIPDRDIIYQSLEEHAIATMRYIETIGPEQKGYRIFCLWSFFLGLKTLPILKANAVKELKLGRALTQALFEKLELLANNPSELRQIFQKLLLEAEFAPSGSYVKQNNISDWIPWPKAMQFYQGHLLKEDLRLLNLVGS